MEIKDAISTLLVSLLCLTMGVLLGVWPDAAPVNAYLAVGCLSFMSGMFLAIAIIIYLVERKKSKQVNTK